MSISSIVAGIAVTAVGAVAGVGTMVGVVNSQTGAPEHSPTSVEQPVINYGS